MLNPLGSEKIQPPIDNRGATNRRPHLVAVLDYLTGLITWRKERLVGGVTPANGLMITV